MKKKWGKETLRIENQTKTNRGEKKISENKPVGNKSKGKGNDIKIVWEKEHRRKNESSKKDRKE